MNKFRRQLANYEKAFMRFKEAVSIPFADKDSVYRDGTIQRFEFTTDLAWKTTREYLLQQGETDINSPKPVMRAAYRMELIDDDAGWSAILDDRNTTSHVYDDAEADDIYCRIKDEYVGLFEELLEKLQKKA